MTQSDIMSAFSAVYWAAIEEYRKNQVDASESLTVRRFKSEFRASLKWLIKHCGTLVPPGASEKAIEIARQGRVDLFALQWKDQPKAEEALFGKRGRNVFIHEHEIPVSQLFNEILNADSQNEIFEILKSQSIVWITKEEEQRLHVYQRNENAYLEAGIIAKTNPYGDDWMERNWKI